MCKLPFRPLAIAGPPATRRRTRSRPATRAHTRSRCSSGPPTAGSATTRRGDSPGRRGSEEPHGHRVGPGDELRVASLREPAVREEHDRVFPPVTRVAAAEHRSPLLVDREGKARAVQLEDHAGGAKPRRRAPRPSRRGAIGGARSWIPDEPPRRVMALPTIVRPEENLDVVRTGVLGGKGIRELVTGRGAVAKRRDGILNVPALRASARGERTLLAVNENG